MFYIVNKCLSGNTKEPENEHKFKHILKKENFKNGKEYKIVKIQKKKSKIYRVVRLNWANFKIQKNA